MLYELAIYALSQLTLCDHMVHELLQDLGAVRFVDDHVLSFGHSSSLWQ